MVQVIKTEHLKACPFCGGKAELITNRHALKEGHNCYKVFCTECGMAGKTFLDGETFGFENRPSRTVSPEEAIRKAVEVWNHRECDDKMVQAEREREVFCISLSESETSTMMEAVKLYQYSNGDELRFCGNMARLYGCKPRNEDSSSFYGFLVTLYHYGKVQGIRAERTRRKRGQRA